MTTTSHSGKTPLLPFTWIAASALTIGGSATAQLNTAQAMPITTIVKDAGVYHLATGTWTRGASNVALAGPEVLYDNTCTVGFYWGMQEGDVLLDSGRIPSTSSPSLPIAPGPRTSLTGLYDFYEVDGFEIGYCSFEPLRTTLTISFTDSYAVCDGGGTLPAPLAAFDLVNIPAGTAIGGQGCWIVAINLSNTTLTFDLGGDGDGTYSNTPSTDSFGWSWTQSIPTTGSDSGPILAGDPLGFFANTALPCALGLGGGTTFVGGSNNPGSGIGILDQLEIGDGPTAPGCYWFGGYTAMNPMAAFYMKLTGGESTNGAAINPDGKFAIRGVGQGVTYQWEVLNMSDESIAMGNATTVFGASAAEMRTQLVLEIHDAADGLIASVDGWSPGGSWSAFTIGYTLLGVDVEIQLVVDTCNVSNSALASPCQFNPEIAGAHPVNSGTPFCFGDGTGTPCPCGNIGGLGEGCANPAGTGALLVGLGNASLGSDTLRFKITGVNGQRVGILLRAGNQLGGGAGVQLGSGLLCISGNSARSQTVFTDASGAVTVPKWHGEPYGTTANSPGTATQYQYWYRDPNGACGFIFNFSNAWTVTYKP